MRCEGERCEAEQSFSKEVIRKEARGKSCVSISPLSLLPPLLPSLPPTRESGERNHWEVRVQILLKVSRQMAATGKKVSTSLALVLQGQSVGSGGGDGHEAHLLLGRRSQHKIASPPVDHGFVVGPRHAQRFWHSRRSGEKWRKGSQTWRFRSLGASSVAEVKFHTLGATVLACRDLHCEELIAVGNKYLMTPATNRKKARVRDITE